MLDTTMAVTGEMAWYLPVLIFLARVCDVSIGTVRTILVISGHPWISAVLGFFEVIIWVLAVGGVIAFLTNPFALLGYAGGFATGIILGMFIEERIALGHRIVRVVSTNIDIHVSHNLRERGYRVTQVDGRGRDGPVELAYLIVKRKEVDRLQKDLAEIDPKAFVSVGHADRPTAHTLGKNSRFGMKNWVRGMGVRK